MTSSLIDRLLAFTLGGRFRDALSLARTRTHAQTAMLEGTAMFVYPGAPDSSARNPKPRLQTTRLQMLRLIRTWKGLLIFLALVRACAAFVCTIE
jgi:hypothetical protein